MPTPLLLSKNEFEALQTLRQAKIKRNGTTSRFQSNNEHILIGYPERFSCQSCGGKIISSGNVYTCGKYNTNGKKGCGASYFSVNADWLENKIISEIEKITSEKNLKKYYDTFISLYKTKDNGKKEKANLEKGLAEKEKAQSNLIKSLTGMSEMNEFAIKAITKELESVSKDIELIKKELQELKNPILIKIPTFKEFESKVQRDKSLLIRSNCYAKRDLIWTFVKVITLDPIERRVIVELRENPFNMYMDIDYHAKALQNVVVFFYKISERLATLL